MIINGFWIPDIYIPIILIVLLVIGYFVSKFCIKPKDFADKMFLLFLSAFCPGAMIIVAPCAAILLYFMYNFMTDDDK